MRYDGERGLNFVLFVDFIDKFYFQQKVRVVYILRLLFRSIVFSLDRGKIDLYSLEFKIVKVYLFFLCILIVGDSNIK